MLDASERYYKVHGEPLFSSHMIDLSEEPIEENIEICVSYLERMAKMDMLLEMELGITGGEPSGCRAQDCPHRCGWCRQSQMRPMLAAVPGARLPRRSATGPHSPRPACAK